MGFIIHGDRIPVLARLWAAWRVGGNGSQSKQVGWKDVQSQSTYQPEGRIWMLVLPFQGECGQVFQSTVVDWLLNTRMARHPSSPPPLRGLPSLLCFQSSMRKLGVCEKIG